MLNIEKLAAGYGGLRVLFDVDMVVPDRSVVGVVGPNGAGKSTLLLAIAGVVPPRSGRISFDGNRVDALRSPEIVTRGIVLCPQGRMLFPHMTVVENLRLGGFVNRHRPDVKQSLDRIFEYFPALASRRRQLASSLSGGEQQMVAIGRAMMARPRLLMLDEPSTGLAPSVVNFVAETLLRLVREENISILLVEQNIELALGTSESLYVVEHGHTRFYGSQTEFRSDEEIVRRYFES